MANRDVSTACILFSVMTTAVLLLTTERLSGVAGTPVKCELSGAQVATALRGLHVVTTETLLRFLNAHEGCIDSGCLSHPYCKFADEIYSDLMKIEEDMSNIA